MKRGDVYRRQPVDRLYVIVSAAAVARTGVVIVAEVTATSPAVTGLISVPLSGARGDSIAGVVRADRISYVSTTRVGEHVGSLAPSTLELVDMALRVVLDLD